MSLPTLSDAGLPQPGDVIAGKYQVESVLGAGGMGIVVSARHLDLGQRVALKLLRSVFATNTDVIARFQREARALAGIRSEHVVRVHDVARLESGAPYLVMEHLTGKDLDQLLRARGPLPIAEAIDYVLQACEAIAEAHATGIVHRDLKPANLFLTTRADGSSLVKVLDFGISKLTGLNDVGVPEGSLTSTSEILGSPWYMSPEQLRSFKNVDARTDVWALGVILYRLITGRQPFDADSLSACITKIVADPPIPLRLHRPDAPLELESLILRCLEKDTARRVQNIAELARGVFPFAPPRSAISVERIVGVLSLATPVEELTIQLPAARVVSSPSLQSAPELPALGGTGAVRAVSSPRLQSVPELPALGGTSTAVANQVVEPVQPRAVARRPGIFVAVALGVLAALGGLGAFVVGTQGQAAPAATSPVLEAGAAVTPSALPMPSASASATPPTPGVSASAALIAAPPAKPSAEPSLEPSVALTTGPSAPLLHAAQPAPKNERAKAPSVVASVKPPAPATSSSKPPEKKPPSLIENSL